MQNELCKALREGDWLLFPDSGAYSLAGACDFNGIAASTCRTFYIWQGPDEQFLTNIPPHMSADSDQLKRRTRVANVFDDVADDVFGNC